MSSSAPCSHIHELERVNTTIDRIKGKIKAKPEDFIVEERIRGVQLEIIKNYNDKEYLKEYLKKISNGEKEEKEKEDKKWLICILEKKGIDNFKAIHIISSYLNISPNRITIAGIKDKKAHTVQLISLYNVNENKIKIALPYLHQKYNSITLYPLSYGKKVYLGELEGNRFKINIREKMGDLSDVISAYKKSYDMYFPNYYGEQRFGGKDMHSIDVAKYILRGEIKEAINAFILKNRHKEVDLESMDIKNIIELKEKIRGLYERRVLDYLLNHNLKDYAAAWNKVIPDSLKRLIINTYQSYIFNLVASQIIRECKERYGEEESIKKCKDMEILLPSPESLRKIKKEEYENKITEILEKDGISYESFSAPLITRLGIKGVKRKIIEQAREVKILKEKEDESTIQFFLKKGSYATEFLREIVDFLQ